MLRAASVVALAAASLAGKHDVRRRLSEPPDGCALYVAGPVVASKGNQVATVDSLQNYELTFTMELASDWVHSTGDYQSVLHIGDSDGQRFPGIWFHYADNKIYVAQSQSYCNAYCGSGQYTSYSTIINFAAGETYEIKVIVENNQMTVHVDGALVGTASGSATYTATDAAVYVGDPWYDPADKVTLSDITLSGIGLTDACREYFGATGIEHFDATTTTGTDDSDDNSLLILGVVAAVVVIVGIVFAIMKRRKSAKSPSEARTPVAAVVREPTAPPLPSLAPIKAIEMMAQEPTGANATKTKMYHRMQVWYNEAPETAALRAAWGAYPTTPRALEAWPGFVQVTNAFLDHAGPPVAPAASRPEAELEPEC